MCVPAPVLWITGTVASAMAVANKSIDDDNTAAANKKEISDYRKAEIAAGATAIKPQDTTIKSTVGPIADPNDPQNMALSADATEQARKRKLNAMRLGLSQTISSVPNKTVGSANMPAPVVVATGMKTKLGA